MEIYYGEDRMWKDSGKTVPLSKNRLCTNKCEADKYALEMKEWDGNTKVLCKNENSTFMWKLE